MTPNSITQEDLRAFKLITPKVISKLLFKILHSRFIRVDTGFSVSARCTNAGAFVQGPLLVRSIRASELGPS